MSLEDGEEAPISILELGDKVFVLPPGKSNVFMQLENEDWVFTNKYQYTLYYYVKETPPNPIHETRGIVEVVFMPISRRNELAPR